MKIVAENPTPLSNPEVLQILKERKQSGAALPSELQVLKTLEQRGTSTKPREDLQAFAVALKAEFKKLTSEDLVQLINHAPSSIFEAYLCLENAITADRITEDDLDRIVEIVAQHLIN